ncbi:MAG: nucleotidyl transferase AbiEii/AbiGii toxin family protein [Phycisphaerae bacterium]|nr:nucleotidyl transferase AbiEii/AbiGii toxin family protein [Phycisphaerae bacterium]
MTPVLGPFSLERVVNAVERVRQRLLKATAALEAAGIPYAVAGGNAVALWVSRVDEAAVRTTQDVDILLRRPAFEAARTALEAAGFVYRHIAGIDSFLDDPQAKVRSAVHLIFAGERVWPDESIANPDVTESEQASEYRVLSLPAIVQIKLTAFRDKDKTHLRDLIDVGLVDATWLSRLPDPLAPRLKQLLDTPGR